MLKHRLLVLVGYEVVSAIARIQNHASPQPPLIPPPVTFTFIPWHGSKLLYVICSLTVIASATQQRLGAIS